MRYENSLSYEVQVIIYNSFDYNFMYVISDKLIKIISPIILNFS